MLFWIVVENHFFSSEKNNENLIGNIINCGINQYSDREFPRKSMQSFKLEEKARAQHS